MKKRPPKPVIAAIVLSLAGGIGYYIAKSHDSGDMIFVSGTVEATEADLGFQVSGRLEKVDAREGDQVALGQELAVLDRAELLAEREAANAQVASAQALLSEMLNGSRSEEIGQARAKLRVAVDRRDAAKRDLERLRPLAQQQLISKQAFDQAQTDADVGEGEVTRATEELRLLTTGTRPERIAAQRAALAEANAALVRIDALLSQTAVKAPFGGTVTIRHREPGEAVGPGAAVLTLENLNDRWVRVYVPGDDVGRLSLGQCAEIASDGFAERRYPGVISYIARVAEFTPRNVQSTRDRVRLVYEVRVRITGDEAIDLKPGLPGDVTFANAATSTQAVCAPTGATALGAN